MYILGIETSCDETAAAVVKDGREILSNVVFSQEKMHRPFKGIVPEIASRSHVENINRVIERAIGDAGKNGGRGGKGNVFDAVAVTAGPGLVGSLLVGKMAAEALSWVHNVPLVGVNHLESHLFSNLLEHEDLKPPFLGLVVSGGHTDLVLVEKYGKYKVLGRTRDDAAGESFDKVANIIGLGYPGGPLIDQYSKYGNPDAISFTRPYLKGSWDFSFSGLKTAVLYFWHNEKRKQSSKVKADMCASFQAAVVDVLVKKTLLAAEEYGMKSLAIGGGVASNSMLRQRFMEEGRKENVKIYFPSKKLCTDNAAMTACAGYYKWNSWRRSGGRECGKNGAGSSISVNPALPIANWIQA